MNKIVRAKTLALFIILAVFVTSLASCKDDIATSSNVSSSNVATMDTTTEHVEGSGTATSDMDTQPTDSTASPINTTPVSASTTAPVKIDMNKLRGTTVRLLWWHPLTQDEENIIKDFTRKTGIKVTTTETTTDDYQSKLASMVIAKDSPDVAIIPTSTSQGAFPVGVLATMQPISVTGQNLNDSFWDKRIMDAYKINGKYYCFSSPNSWFSNATVVFYNVDLFEENGITTPRDLWKSGKWDWTTLKNAAAEIMKIGTGYYGLASPDSMAFLSSAGVDYVSYNGKTFKNTITDSNVLKACTFNAELVNEGLEYPATGTSPAVEYLKGKIGMYATNTWSMRKDADFGNAKFEIDAVPFPSPKGSKQYIGSRSNLFAIPKNANNPQGAGVFLRYLLDKNNYPRTFDAVSINPKMKDTFDFVTASSANRAVLYSTGVVGYSNASDYGRMNFLLLQVAPNQVNTLLQSNKSMFDTAVINANKALNK